MEGNMNSTIEQETDSMAPAETASVIESNGAPDVCTAKIDQNPPVREKLPLVVGCAFASGWPIVPLMAKTPPVLVPPPPPMTNWSME